jgi:uncharacterized PurR-regulated membrane protein YhhQ (DUF165 family)
MQSVEQAAPVPPSAPTRRGLLPASTVPRLAVAAVAAYAGAQVISDITSVKIGVAFGRAVDMGTWIYPITFTLRDVVHKMLGRRAARTLVVSCAFVNLFMALYLQWVARARATRPTCWATSSSRSWARCGASWWPRSSPRWSAS